MDSCKISATAKRAHLRNILETSKSRVANLGPELLNFRTEVNERTASNSALGDGVIAAWTRLKDVNDVRTVEGAHLCALETK